MKHTGKSWQMIEDGENDLYIREVPIRGMAEWPVPQTICGDILTRADARLIAMSPELLNVLKIVKLNLEGKIIGGDLTKIITTAIEKAEGES